MWGMWVCTLPHTQCVSILGGNLSERLDMCGVEMLGLPCRLGNGPQQPPLFTSSLTKGTKGHTPSLEELELGMNIIFGQ